MSATEVSLIDWMGTDDSVVNAARVSFNKTADKYTQEQNERLIDFLAKHGHWSPFAHTCLSFRIKAPIFVARQLAKHQVGLAWNEVSRRYVTVEPEAWKPNGLRKAAENVKQGSSDELVQNERLTVDMMYAMDIATRTYNTLLREGVCPEQARAVLPQGMMTEWIWTGSLYAFFRVVQQRTAPTAQKETYEVARYIDVACFHRFPICWAALVRNT
jgi:thymidylate synthase (FAD)